MIFLVTLLANHCVHDSLQDVFLREHTLHILDQLVGFVDFIVLKIVDHEVEARLGDHINQRRQNLQGILTATEHNQVMAKKVIVLEETSRSCRVLELLKLNLSGLSVVELIMVASLQVD